MQKPATPLRRYAATLTIIGSLFASQAEAQLINFDLTGSTADAYSTGAGVFGTASSQWNIASRLNSATNLSLFDDTHTATSVTVSYSRLTSGSTAAITGTFSRLGNSALSTTGVTLSGLTAGGAYQLAIFSGWGGVPSFTIGSTTKTITSPTVNWSSLIAGSHYVLFQTIANNLGQISFTPNTNPTGVGGASLWTAFQLQDVPATVPEPSYAALMMAGLGAWLSKRRTARLA
ncbi:MAG: PEP-CTERM sorting domain-containing protein [Methylococcales bacterium]|nr:PEP-CTERM sorting domain-containing protein [Methylococcales bacterium]